MSVLLCSFLYILRVQISVMYVSCCQQTLRTLHLFYVKLTVNMAAMNIQYSYNDGHWCLGPTGNSSQRNSSNVTSLPFCKEWPLCTLCTVQTQIHTHLYTHTSWVTLSEYLSCTSILRWGREKKSRKGRYLSTVLIYFVKLVQWDKLKTFDGSSKRTHFIVI